MSKGLIEGFKGALNWTPHGASVTDVIIPRPGRAHTCAPNNGDNDQYSTAESSAMTFVITTRCQHSSDQTKGIVSEIRELIYLHIKQHVLRLLLQRQLISLITSQSIY